VRGGTGTGSGVSARLIAIVGSQLWLEDRERDFPRDVCSLKEHL